SQRAHSVPPGWTHTGRVNPSHEVQLTFALRQRGVGRLAWLVDAVSDPHSPRYGQYLSLEQVRDLVQPSPVTLMAVLKWLQSHGVENCRSVTTLDFLECHMPARGLSRVSAWAVRAPQPRAGCLCARSWCWGESQPVIWSTGNKACISVRCLGQPRTSSCLLWGHRVPTEGLRIELQETLQHQSSGSVWSWELVKHGRCSLLYKVSCAGGKWSSSLIHSSSKWGGKGAGGRAENRHAAGQAHGWLSRWCESSRRHESQEPFLAWLLLLSNTSSVPWVHSVSYGDDEDSLSLAYMKRVNVEFMKAAARGLTILFASGDDGAGCRRVPGGNHTFRPSFPASSPYVTTVGGTSFKNPFLVTAEVTDYISGGGFSNVFPMPDYQVR
ncbi:Tripeptidyl-peptidase 1, partial [Phoenicopterus ruber ruber]